MSASRSSTGISRTSTLANASPQPAAAHPEHINSYGPVPGITFVPPPPPTFRNRSRVGSIDGSKSPGSSINQCTLSDDHKAITFSRAPYAKSMLIDVRCSGVLL